MAKVTELKRKSSIYKKSISNQEILEVTYIIGNKEYKQIINVSKKSPLCRLYYSSLEKYVDIKTHDCKIYVSKRFPKLIIDNIDRLIINFLVGILSILISIILYFI